MDQLMIRVSQHPLISLLTLGTVLSVIWLELLRKRLRTSWWAAVLLGIAHTLIGVLSVKAFAVIEGADAGAMSLFGGVFFMPLTYILGAKLFKRPLGEVADVFTPVMVVTLMCARINCILSGCCMGLPIPGVNGVRFPTREAELIFYLVLLILLCPKIWRGRTGGRAYPVYVMAYGVFRFIVEFFRDQNTTSLFHLSHFWAVVSLCIGISIYVEISKKEKFEKRGLNK